MTLDDVLRDEGGRIRSTLIRLTGDFDLAEDALADASVAALEYWRITGPPANPGAWLTTTARNKAFDRLRREAKRTEKERESMRLLEGNPEHEPEDLLRLIFTCCHPALSPEAQVALSLRVLCGLSTQEIARAFFVPEPTMGQRISRAKKKIATARIPYRVPDDHELPGRLPAVLAVLYVMFTTGHHAVEGEANARVSLAQDAIRLGRDLARLMPDESEMSGLLALMLATNARHHARVDEHGQYVLLADQDRGRWDHSAIAEAAALVEANLRRGGRGPYLIQAAISCLHGTAPSFDDTDWPQIVELYRMLEEVMPTPVVRVNRSVAESKVHGPEAALALLDGAKGLEHWYLFWAARAEFLSAAGDRAAAAVAYRRALTCPINDADRRLLEARLVATSQ